MGDALPPLVQEYRANADQLLRTQDDIKKSTDDMASETERSGERQTRSWIDVAKGTLVGKLAYDGLRAALRAVSGAVRTGINESKEAAAVNAQLEAGIKSTGNAANVTVAGMNALATEIERYSGQTDDSIGKTQQLLLTFTNIRNVGADRIFDDVTRAAADMAARMGGDAASKAVLLGKALNDPVKGLTALTRVGVSFTQAQKDQIRALQESGDLLGAQKLILAELNKEFGGSAAAAGQTFPGALERAKRSVEGLAQSVVDKFLPIITPAINRAVDLFQSITPKVEAVAGRIAQAFTSGGGGLGGLFSDVGAQIQKFIGGGGLEAALNKAAEFRQKLFDAIMKALPGILDAFVAFVPQLIGFITGTFIPQLVDQFTTLVTQLVDVAATLIPQLVTALADSAPGLISGAMTAFLSILTALLAVIPQIIDTVVNLVPQVVGTLVDMLPALIDGALAFFTGILDALVVAIPLVVTALASAIPKLIGSLVDAIPSLVDGALQFFLGMISALVTAIPQVIAALVQAIPLIIIALVDALPDLISGAIQLFLGLVIGLVTATPKIVQAVIQAIPVIVKALIDAAPKLLEAGGKLMGAFASGLKGAADGVWKAIKGVAQGAVNGLIDIINGFISGLNQVTGGIRDVTNGAVDFRISKIPRVSFDVGTDRVPGQTGAPLVAVIHGGEAIASNAMLAGREPLPPRIMAAAERQQAATASPAAVSTTRTSNVTVYAQTNASPQRIGAELGWVLNREG